MEKDELRQRLRLARAALPVSDRRHFAAAAVQHLISIPNVSGVQNIGLFASVRDEIDTRPVFEHLISMGKTVFFPRMQKSSHALTWGALASWDALVAGPMGIGQPEEAPSDAQELDLIVVPGLGFGLNGGRLGYGAGWYDRTLDVFKGPVVGLGYNCQVLDFVPAEAHDQPVHWIVTELRAIPVGN